MRALHGKKISSLVSKGRLLSAGKLSIYGERRERTTTISRLLLRAALAWLLYELSWYSDKQKETVKFKAHLWMVRKQ